MELENVDNVGLIARITGKPAAVELARRYERLGQLAVAAFEELKDVKGIGPAKAAAIRASFLLAQRLSKECYQESPLLDTPDRVADLLREQNRPYTVEHMQIVLLNTRRRLISVHDLSQGTLDSLLVHAREVFALAISRRASALILAHNHPSGDPTPSEADIRITRDLVRAGQLLRIEVLDHVILGKSTTERPCDFLSLRALGYFY